MKRYFSTSLLLLFLLVLAACAPAISVSNNTTIPVRVVVLAGGLPQTVSPSPGESSGVEVDEGPYRATVIADAEWIAYAKGVRTDLNEQLKNSETLSGPKLLDVIRRLKEIAQRMSEFQAAGGSAASCTGRISEQGSGTVQVNVAANGTLTIACR